MNKKISWGLILITMLYLGSCGVLTNSKSELIAIAKEAQVQGQQLPITAKAIIGSEEIELEVAQTSQQQAMGLMYREELPPGRGMFFPFTQSRIARFWMKNVPVALDMVFLQQGKVVAIANSVPPCNTSEEDCPVYGPDTFVDGVIELKSGRAKELNIGVGDIISIEFLDSSQ